MARTFKEKIQRTLENHPQNKGIVLRISHGGENEEGISEADIYDLYIWDTSDQEIVHYNYENWYTPNDLKNEFMVVRHIDEHDFFRRYSIGKNEFLMFDINRNYARPIEEIS